MNEEMLYAAISEIKQGLDSLLRSGLSANARAIKINELKKALDDLFLKRKGADDEPSDADE